MTGIYTRRFVPNFVGRLKSWMASGKKSEQLNRTAHEVLSEITSNQDLITAVCYLWGDLGQPPKKISFLQLASVLNHYKNGGYYPVGGSAVIAQKVIKSIHQYGGRVLVGMGVKEIVAYKDQVMGVKMDNGDYIKSRQVVSCASLNQTFNKMLPRPDVMKQLDRLSCDPACLVLFVGLKAGKEALGIKDNNIWQFISNDCDADLQRFDEKMGEDAAQGFPVMFLGSGSAKDPAWKEQGKTTLEIITFAKKAWWEQWQDQKCLSRDEDYQTKKNVLIDRLLEDGLYLNYPKCRGQVEVVDLGTPLTCEHYLGSHEGSIYGVAHTVTRLHPRFDKVLTPYTPVRGLFMSGQDITGAGVISAL